MRNAKITRKTNEATLFESITNFFKTFTLTLNMLDVLITNFLVSRFAGMETGARYKAAASRAYES